MPRVTVELDFKQIENIIEELTPEQQKEIERKIWAMEMDKIVSKIRKNAKKNKITQKEIDRICKEVRQELYEKRCKSCNRY
jgi:transcriptional regulator NrdR family protein